MNITGCILVRFTVRIDAKGTRAERFEKLAVWQEKEYCKGVSLEGAAIHTIK